MSPHICRHCRLSEEHAIHTTALSRHAHPFVADEEEADPANLVPNAIDYVVTNLEIIEGLIVRLAELAREATVAGELVFRMQARLLAARAGAHAADGRGGCAARQSAAHAQPGNRAGAYGEETGTQEGSAVGIGRVRTT